MSYASEQGVLNAQFNTEIMRCLPHVLMRPNLIQDGNAWLALYGNLPSGVVGTGFTPAEAMADFDEAWTRKAVKPPGYGFKRPNIEPATTPHENKCVVTDEMVEAGVAEIRKAKHTCFDRWTDHQSIRAVLVAALKGMASV